MIRRNLPYGTEKNHPRSIRCCVAFPTQETRAYSLLSSFLWGPPPPPPPLPPFKKPTGYRYTTHSLTPLGHEPETLTHSILPFSPGFLSSDTYTARKEKRYAALAWMYISPVSINSLALFGFDGWERHGGRGDGGMLCDGHKIAITLTELCMFSICV